MTEVKVVHPRSFGVGRSHARNRLKEFGGSVENPGDAPLVPADIFKYLFNLQGALEKEGAMDYRKYARRMWGQISSPNEIKIAPNEKGFATFEKLLIAGLHGIDMSEMVYPHLNDSMAELIEKYGDEVETIALWSTGDVSATGYQLGKIDRSGVIGSFFRSLHDKLSKRGRAKFVKEKTAYLVDDDKYSRLSEFVVERRAQNPDGVVKLIIIEDSAGNFEKAEKELAKQVGAGVASIFPIWFTESREGVTAQEKIDELEISGNIEEFEREKENLELKKKRLNSISSFRELLDSERFGEMFKGAHVMVDFDGVVCDNIEMRKRQASITYNALLQGVMEWFDDDLTGAQQRIEERLKAVKS